VAGAAQASEVEQMLWDAGFSEVSIEIKEESAQFIRDWFPGSGVENYVRSAVIYRCKVGKQI
jgi:hypothetical protein